MLRGTVARVDWVGCKIRRAALRAGCYWQALASLFVQRETIAALLRIVAFFRSCYRNQVYAISVAAAIGQVVAQMSSVDADNLAVR